MTYSASQPPATGVGSWMEGIFISTGTCLAQEDVQK